MLITFYNYIILKRISYMVGFEPAGSFEFLLTYLPIILRYRLLILYAQILMLHIHGELTVINFPKLFSYRYNGITNTLRI